MGHVKRFASIRVGQRQQLDQRACGIRQWTNPQAFINLAGRLWDIAGRVVQPEPGFQIIAFAFRDDFAMVVRVKAIRHHPVQSGNCTNFLSDLLTEHLHATGGL